MSDLPAISVLIASHGRPALLVRALRFIAQSDHPALEVVVAADAAGLGALAAAGFAGRIKTREVAVANIAVARNAALGAAAGGIVAFIDDDAVPEPGWARALALAFADPRRVAAGGRVRRRGGWEDEAPPVAVDSRGAAPPLGRGGGVAAGTRPAPPPRR
ncbi:MAG: glycosyltransferase, partial [Gemmobacter sp.]